MLERISTQIVFMLFDASLKAILLWALALLVTRTLRGMSVHAEHRVWTVVLLALAMLPVLAHAGPSWSLPRGIWRFGSPAVNAHAFQSQAAFADRGSGALADRSTDFLDRSPNNLRQDLRSVPLPGARITDVKSANPTYGTTSFELVGRQASPFASSHRQSFLRRSSLFLLGSLVWLAGIGVMLVRLLIAVFRAVRIQRAALLVTDRFFPTGAVVRESEQIECPVVVGWWRPCILLPRSWREWTAANAQPSSRTSFLTFAEAIFK